MSETSAAARVLGLIAYTLCGKNECAQEANRQMSSDQYKSKNQKNNLCQKCFTDIEKRTWFRKNLTNCISIFCFKTFLRFTRMRCGLDCLFLCLLEQKKWKRNHSVFFSFFPHTLQGSEGFILKWASVNHCFFPQTLSKAGVAENFSFSMFRWSHWPCSWKKKRFRV